MTLHFPLHGLFQLSISHARDFDNPDHNGVLAGDTAYHLFDGDAALTHDLLDRSPHRGGVSNDIVLDHSQRSRADSQRGDSQPGLTRPKFGDLDLLRSDVQSNNGCSGHRVTS